MIENSSSIDRPVVAQRNPKMIALAVAAAIALAVLAFAFPSILRWTEVERSLALRR